MTTPTDSPIIQPSPKPKSGRGAGWLGRFVRRFPFRIVRVLGIGCIAIPKDHPARREHRELREEIEGAREILMSALDRSNMEEDSLRTLAVLVVNKLHWQSKEPTPPNTSMDHSKK